MSERSEMPLTWYTEPKDVIQWLSERRCVAATVGGVGGPPGVMFRQGRTTHLAVVPETLVYDGKRVTIK